MRSIGLDPARWNRLERQERLQESGVPILIRLHGSLKSEVRSFKGEGGGEGGGETPLDNALVKRVDTAVKIDIFRDGHDTPTDANNSPLPLHGRIHRPVDNPARNLVTLVSRNYRGPRISTMNSAHPAFELCVWNSPKFVRNAPWSYLNLLHLLIRIILSGKISVFQENVFMEFLRWSLEQRYDRITSVFVVNGFFNYP